MRVETLLCLLVCPVMASGFVISKGQWRIYLESRWDQADEVFDHQGQRNDHPEQSGIENGLDSWSSLIFIRYGLTSRWTVEASTQYKQTTFAPLFGPDQSRSGISDIWLNAVYDLWPAATWSWVLNAGSKTPMEKNRPRFPQITSGEPEYNLSLGLGRGWDSAFLETELGYRFRSGTVNNVGDGGIPYENEWYGSAKAGYRWQRLLLEASLDHRDSISNLQAQYIPGVYMNGDESKLRVGVDVKINASTAVGCAYQQTLEGKNTTLNQSYAIRLSFTL